MTTIDAVLLNRWQRDRDAQAFAELVARYSGMVHGVCKRITLDESRSEDLAQDCFMELARSRPKIGHSLGPWLHRVATNVAISEVRSHSRRVKREKDYSSQATGLAEPSWDDIQEYVDEAVNGLSEMHRTAIVLHFFEGRTQEAIADKLGVPRTTVTSRIKRGIDEVRKELKRCGVVVPAATLASLFAKLESSAAPLSLTTSLGKAALAGKLPQAAASGISWTSPIPLAGLVIIVAGLGVGLTREFLSDSETALVEDATSSIAIDAPAVIGDGAKAEARDGRAESVGSGSAAEDLLTVSQAQIAKLPVRVSQALDGPSMGSISGRIYDKATGASIAGALVRSTPADKGYSRQIQTETGPDGRYSLLDLEDGAYEIMKGYAPGYPRSGSRQVITVTIKDAEALADIDFAVDRGVRVAGRVLDSNGDPVPGAWAAATAEGSCCAERATTVNDGSFEVYLGPAEGEVYALAYNDDYASLLWGPEKIGTPTTHDIELRLTLPRSATISGTVVDASGRTVPGASVRPRLLPAEEKLYDVDELLRVTRDPRTGGAGHFTASGLVAGLYRVILSPPGANGWSTLDEVTRLQLGEAQQLQGLRLVLGEKGGLAIEGAVTDSNGDPVAHAQLMAFGTDRVSSSVYADDSGRFRITGLDPGNYRLSVHASGFDSSQASTSATAGTSGVQIILLANGALSGRVVDDRTGEPIPEFELFYMKGGAQAFGPGLLMNRREVRDPDGRFARDSVYAGPATLTARAPGFGTAFITVEVLPGEIVSGLEIRIRPSEGIVGKVVDSGGQPVGDALVFFEGIPDERWRTEQSVATTSADGHFGIDSAPEGLKRLLAYRPGFAPGASRVSNETVIVLPDAARLEGRVTLGGEPFQDPSIHVSALTDISVPNSGRQPDSDGGYVFDDLPPGPLQVTAFYGRIRRMTGFVNSESGNVTKLDFPFAFGSSVVEGRVASFPTGIGAVSVAMKVVTAYGEEDFLTQGESGQGEWRYSFDEVPAGRAWLKAEMLDDSRMIVTRYSREFEILDDALHEVNLEEVGTSSIVVNAPNLQNRERAYAQVLKGEFFVPTVYQQMVAQQIYPFEVGRSELNTVGTGEFTGLHPGVYTVVVLTAPEGGERDNSLWRWSSKIAEIGKNEETSVEIRLR